MEVKSKPGWQTTEFWLTLAAVVGNVLIASGVIPSDSVAMTVTSTIVAGLAALGYTCFRTAAKHHVLNTARDLCREKQN